MIPAYDGAAATAELGRYHTVVQRAQRVHEDLTRIAGLLRDDEGVEVWTETPSDDSRVTDGKTPYSLEGWRVHFRTVQTLFGGLSTQERNRLGALDGNAVTAVTGFLASASTLATAFQGVVQSYRDGSDRQVQAPISQAHRDALATAIEAELG